jgi:hypothetical protein
MSSQVNETRMIDRSSSLSGRKYSQFSCRSREKNALAHSARWFGGSASIGATASLAAATRSRQARPFLSSPAYLWYRDERGAEVTRSEKQYSFGHHKTYFDDGGIMHVASTALSNVLAAILVLTVACAFCTQRAAAGSTHNLSVYTRAEQGQFVDKSDDRTRGEGKNPFGDFSDVYSISQSENKGPFPGDTTSITLNVYSDASLQSRVGTGAFFCQYSFAKDAFCDATFQVPGGSLVADGQLNFNASGFTLAVIGGTGAYEDVTTGTVVAVPGALHAEHVTFQLQ